MEVILPVALSYFSSTFIERQGREILGFAGLPHTHMQKMIILHTLRHSLADTLLLYERNIQAKHPTRPGLSQLPGGW